jgi:SIR2-like domain
MSVNKKKSENLLWGVVVIDDSCRFSLHVWRYLSRSLGFGVGEIGRGGIPQYKGWGTKPWLEKGVAYPSEDGRFKLWWVSADGEWKKEVDRIMASSSDGRWLFLVDVHGDSSSEYDVKKVAEHLNRRSRRGRVQWKLVSAYYAGEITGEKVALPKTRETLKGIREEIYPDEEVRRAKGRGLSAGSKGICHLLVTGAGFEISAERGGFGLPLTGKILNEMNYPFYRNEPEGRNTIRIGYDDEGKEPEEQKEIENREFPFPLGDYWEFGDPRAGIRKAAVAKDLDSYWDILLGDELRRRIVSSSMGGERDGQKTDALIWETRMREAFRFSLLKYDWGHMNQSLAAVGLDWHAWLTTNYTQFANRAIAASGEDRFWRVIATAAEARITMREGRRDSKRKSPGDRNRYLFKLHGDIGHLHTMAIAGHDKDVFSPLSTPMEDLYQVYEAAHGFLVDSLGSRGETLAVWHIVGHGMQDRRLCDLLGRVSRQTEKVRHLFLLVNPDTKRPRDFLLEALGKGRKVYACPLNAREYMARLRQAGLPETQDEATKWIEKVATVARALRREEEQARRESG